MKRNYSSYRNNLKGKFRQSKGYTNNSNLGKQVQWLTRQAKISKGVELAERNSVSYGYATTVDTSGAQTHITNISTGTGLGSRKDLKIKLSNLQYRYLLTPADTVNSLRVLILQSKMAGSGSVADWWRASGYRRKVWARES